MTDTFDLTTNPFHLLGTTIDSSAEEITDVYEDALANGRAQEEELDRAHQAIIAPRSRLEFEVASLSGVPVERIDEILDVATRGQLDRALAEVHLLPPLAAANLASHLSGRFPGQAEPVSELLLAWRDIDVSRVLAELSAARARGGFGRVDEKALNAALAALRQRHAKTAVRSIGAVEEPGTEMARLVESELAAVGPSPFLEILVREYDSQSEGSLEEIRGQIREEIVTCRVADPEPTEAAVQRIVRLLDDWDAVNQPVQLLEQAKGHEEARSRQLNEEIRDLALDLSNEHNMHAEALSLTKALLHTFPELDSVAQTLRNDVEALESLVAAQRFDAVLKTLNAAAEKARRQHTRLGSQLRENGFKKIRFEPMASLHAAFSAAIESTKETEAADAPWFILRSLALEIHNEKDDPETGHALLQALLRHRPGPNSEMRARLRSDAHAAGRNAKWKELKAARDDPAAALALAEQLLEGADGQEREGLLALRRTLSNRVNRAGAGRTFGWGAALVFVGFVIVAAFQESDDRATRLPRLQTPPPSDTASRTPERPATVDEVKPPPATNRLLTRAELRYCTFQERRIDFIRPMVNNSEVWRFNAAVNDYNRRCGSFRYSPSTLTSIEREADANESRLRREATAVVEAWRPKSPPLAAGSLLDLNNPTNARRVQSRLKELGYYRGIVDGQFGRQSQAALRAFKNNNPTVAWESDLWTLRTQKFLLGSP